MANEVAVINGVPSIIINGQLVAVPDYAINQDVQNDFGKAGGFPTISIFSSTSFKIKVDDKDEVVPAPVPVVILGVSPGGTANSRSYYAGTYIEGSSEPPDCASSDGISPDAGDAKQSAICATCPQAVFGSSQTGKGQACSQSKTLFVVPAEDPSGQVYQLRVAPTSLKNVAAYGASLSRMGMPKEVVITNLTLVPEAESKKTYGILRPELGGFLTADVAAAMRARAASPEIQDMVVKPAAQAPAAQAPAAQAPAAQTASGFAQAPAAQAPPAQAPPAQAPPAQAPPAQAPAAQAPPAQAPPAQAPPAQAPPAQAPPAQAPPAQAPPAADPIPDVGDPAGLGPDAEGVFWDETLHSSGKTKLLSGIWKKRKGAAAAPVAQAAAPVAQAAAPVAQAAAPVAAQTPPVPEGEAVNNILNKWA